MLNQPLIALVNSILGTGKSTSRGNYAYHCPFCNHHKPKLEINFNENENGENPWHCWACDKKGKKAYQVLKLFPLSWRTSGGGTFYLCSRDSAIFLSSASA